MSDGAALGGTAAALPACGSCCAPAAGLSDCAMSRLRFLACLLASCFRSRACGSPATVCGSCSRPWLSSIRLAAFRLRLPPAIQSLSVCCGCKHDPR